MSDGPVVRVASSPDGIELYVLVDGKRIAVAMREALDEAPAGVQNRATPAGPNRPRKFVGFFKAAFSRVPLTCRLSQAFAPVARSL
jgi:hypothetical protein